MAPIKRIKMVITFKYIENLIIFGFIMLKSKFDVKRNFLIKVFGYLRGKHRLNNGLSARIINNTYNCIIKLIYRKGVLLRLKLIGVSVYKTPYAYVPLLLNN